MFDVLSLTFSLWSVQYFFCVLTPGKGGEGRKCESTGNIWCFLTSWMSKLGMKDLTLATAKYGESVYLDVLTLDCFKWRYIIYCGYNVMIT